MDLNITRKQLPFFFLTTLLSLNAAASSIPALCDGPSMLLNMVDRPTAAFSACAVPYKKAVLETGYQYQFLSHSAGHQQNGPEAEFRLGLPADSELTVILPNYIHQSYAPTSGFTATTVGIKHEIAYTDTWLATVQGFITPSGGSEGFGSHGTGGILIGIFSYSLTPSLAASLMLGGSTQTQSSHDGGQRYNSFIPDLVLSYLINPKTEFYAEVYGLTKTAPNEGSGYNIDAGFLFLPLSNLEIDFELGQRLSGNLGGFNNYLGAGLSVMF